MAPVVPGYDVGRCLGRGGSATVWLVTEDSTGRDFALKCFDGGPDGGPGAEGPDGGEVMRREVGILSALDHGHLVRAHAVVRVHQPPGTDGGTAGSGGPGLLLDYAPGGSLAALVAGRGSLGPGETVTVLTPIAQALAYLHGQGFIHGDVAPGNVLFTAHGKPLLADLGVARMVADAGTMAESGTGGFRDPAPVDAMRAGLQPERDVYSLAALGWYCLTGRVPGPAEQRPPLPLLVPGVPAALAAALEAGLHEDRRLRPAAAEFAAAVFRSAAAEPVDLSVSAHPSVLPELLTRRVPDRSPGGRGRERLRGWWRHALRRGAAVTRRTIPPRRERKGPPRRERKGPPRRETPRHAAGSRRPGPGTRRSSGYGRRVRSGSAVLAAMLALAALWLLAGTRLPGPFPPPGAPPPAATRPAAVPQDVQALLRSADPEQAVHGLARLRSLALSSGDLRLLEEVNAPASPAAAADARIGARLADAGHVLAGFTTVLAAVEASPDSSPQRAVVAVTAASSRYEERDAAGAVVAEAAAAQEQRIRLVLVPVDGRWRIQDVLPGTP